MVDLFDHLDLHRLFQIRQLACLTDPVNRRDRPHNMSLGFSHSRGLHCINAAAIMGVIILNNPELRPMTNLLIAGAAIHDALTPALGDTTKLVDLKKFDEDENFKKIFSRPGWSMIKKKYGLDEVALDSMIKGQGLPGALLDIADKLSYTSIDVEAFIDAGFEYSELFKKAGLIIFNHPDFIQAVIRSIRIRDGEVIMGAQALNRFLLVRAIMFRELYYASEARFLEYAFAKKMVQYLYSSGAVSFAELLSKTDSWLEDIIKQFFYCDHLPMFFEKSRIVDFASLADLEKFVRRARRQNLLDDFIVIPDDFPSRTSSGVDKFKVLSQGRVQKFSEAYPDQAGVISDILQIPEKFSLSLISLSDLHVPAHKYAEVQVKLKKVR